MTRVWRNSMRIGLTAACAVTAATPLLYPPLATPARAQASNMGGIGVTDTTSLRATVTAIDLKSRKVTLTGPQGNSITLTVSDAVRNLPQVKRGDSVTVRYHRSVTYVVAPPGTKPPENSVTAAAGQAAAGQMPAGAVGAKLVITGTVVGVDPAAHRLKLVNPSGGPVHTIDVVTPEGQKAMTMIKVGDAITAVATQAVAIAVDPAK